MYAIRSYYGIFDPQKALDPFDENFDWKALDEAPVMDNKEDMIRESKEQDEYRLKNREKEEWTIKKIPKVDYPWGRAKGYVITSYSIHYTKLYEAPVMDNKEDMIRESKEQDEYRLKNREKEE